MGRETTVLFTGEATGEASGDSFGEATGKVSGTDNVTESGDAYVADGLFSISFMTEGTFPVFESKGDLPTLLRVFRDRLLRPLALRFVRGGEIISSLLDMG
jgi:hypothetical protein